MSQHGTNNFRFALSKAASGAFSISDNFLREIEKNVTYMVILLLYVIQQYIPLFAFDSLLFERFLCIRDDYLCTFNFLYAYTFLHQVLQYAQSQILVKTRFSGKVRKILRNLDRRFDRYYIGQIYSGDFAKICGLLRIYELYTSKFKSKIAFHEN